MTQVNRSIRFPSGASLDQVIKDTQAIRARTPGLTHAQAKELAAQKHLAKSFADGLAKGTKYAAYASTKAQPHQQYCLSAGCKRQATCIDEIGLPRCGHHVNPFYEESDDYEGKIPNDARCFEQGCDAVPVQILGGACFCSQHYDQARSGARFRRLLGS